MLKLILTLPLAVLLTGCETPPPPNNQAGSEARSRYLTTIENCDIYEVSISGHGDVFLSKCRELAESSVSWDEPHGKGRVAVGNTTQVQTITKEHLEQELKQQALSKLNSQERTLLGLTN